MFHLIYLAYTTQMTGEITLIIVYTRFLIPPYIGYPLTFLKILFYTPITPHLFSGLVFLSSQLVLSDLMH